MIPKGEGVAPTFSPDLVDIWTVRSGPDIENLGIFFTPDRAVSWGDYFFKGRYKITYGKMRRIDLP